jgi:DNA (cytosine-5)-methyltransferase 1
MKKPPYRVPSMTEIEAISWNDYKVASTFSGCGGSCLGYRMAGFRVVYANEFIEEAQNTYRANHPDSYLDTRDIRQVKPEDVLEKAGVKRGQLDLLDGSPPCSAFSSAGKREAGWGKVKAYSDKAQRVDDLFFEYVRLIDGIRPKVFVAENVSGLVKGTAKGYFKRILTALREPGYRVICRVLDAQWLGVPQMRQRTIFVGVRNDLKQDPAHPTPLPYRYTVGEAVDGLPTAGEAKWLKPGTDTHRYWLVTKPGDDLSVACQKLTGKDSFRTHYKQSPHQAANTITQATQQLYHWDQPRTLTLQELRRIGGFPDDFDLTGGFTQKWERIGRAVPPLMMFRIAEAVRDEILMKTDNREKVA